MAMAWPTKAKAHAHMQMRQRQNRVNCLRSAAEEWLRRKLDASGFAWSRQAQSGYRLFDFWNHRLGIAVEVDGPEHDRDADLAHDLWLLQCRGILVLRVRNFDEEEAAKALAAIASAESWNKRRSFFCLKAVKE